MSISSSWSTWFYEKIEKGDSREIQMRAGQLVSVFTIFTLGLIMISPEIIDVLGGTAYASGKHVAVPKVQGEIMHFYEITALSDCVPGAFGILEPAGEEKDRIATPGFMLVPGLAFDKNGNRLGYGGGFYDKYLASHEEIITAALGYDFQIVEKVPSESHDRRMDYLIY